MYRATIDRHTYKYPSFECFFPRLHISFGEDKASQVWTCPAPHGTSLHEGDVGVQPKTLADMIEATKEHKVNIASARDQSWDCVTLKSSFTNSWARMLKKWADLAYQGNWEELLRMGIQTPVLINSRRLQERIGAGGAQGRPSAGYTVIHHSLGHQSL